jgi:replication-associated recombination protein RarA
MKDVPEIALNLEVTSKLVPFKEYAVSHPQLVQVDRVLRRAIQEPAGFAHVLVYGPSGVGKTTMIQQYERLSEWEAQHLMKVGNGALDIHFPRYLFQDEEDRRDFQGVLLALREASAALDRYQRFDAALVLFL